MMMKLLLLCVAFWMGDAAAIVGEGGQPRAPRAAEYPTPVQGDFVVKNFRFASGETLPELRLHYRTFGTPARDAQGVVRNAVLDPARHRRDSGAQFLRADFAGELFGAGAARSTPRGTTSSCPTASATASRASRATGCGPAFPATATPTWSRRSTGCSPRGWASTTCGW